MFARFFSLAILIVCAQLAGCAGAPTASTVGGQAVYRGSHGGVVIGGNSMSAAPRVVYGGQSGYGGAYSPDACPSGYRYTNGAYVCTSGHVPQVLGSPQMMQQGSQTFCTIRTVTDNHVNEQMVRVASPDDCMRIGQLVEQAKHSSAHPALGTPPHSAAQPNRCAAGKTWTKLNWPGHPQHDKFVCLPDGDMHRY